MMGPQRLIKSFAGESTMRVASRLTLLLVALTFFLLAPADVVPVKNSGLFGIDQAQAQRAGRRDRSQASGEGIVSQRVADGYNAALEMLEAENYAGAIAILQPLLDGASAFERSTILRFMGNVEISRDRFNQAGTYFQQAIDSGGLAPGDLAGLYLTLGQIYMVDEQYTRAITTLEQYFTTMRVAELSPDPQAYYILAQVYAVADRYREAIAPARAAVDLTSAAPEENFIRLLMSLYLTLDEWNNALPLLQQLVAMIPTKDEYWVQLAGVYSQLGRDDDAFSVFQFRHYMGFLEDSRDLVTLAELYMYHDVPIKAARLLERELASGRVNPTGDNWEKLGNAFFAAREFGSARNALTRAANLSPDGQIYYRIAGTWIQDENWSQALRFLQRAINRGNLNDPGQARILLGHAHNDQNDFEAAEEAFRAAGRYPEFREDSEIWIEHIQARAAALEAEMADRSAYEQEAAEILEQGDLAVNLAEAAMGLAQEAFETARLSTQVTAAERTTLLADATETLAAAREADNDARNPEFGTDAAIRADVRRIGVSSREDGNDELAESLEEGSELFLAARARALTASDQLIRDADDMIFEASEM